MRPENRDFIIYRGMNFISFLSYLKIYESEWILGTWIREGGRGGGCLKFCVRSVQRVHPSDGQWMGLKTCSLKNCVRFRNKCSVTSVLKTHSFKSIRSSSLNSRYRYFRVSAKKKDCWTSSWFAWTLTKGDDYLTNVSSRLSMVI